MEILRKITAALFILLAAVTAVAQTITISGKVVDKADGGGLPGASLTVKGPDGKIRKFASAKAEGDFSISVPGTTEGCRLEVSMMGYTRQSISLDSVAMPLTVEMEAGGIKLKEVAVHADRIREQGDTIAYRVGSFAQDRDRSIGDVLKRMPGIDVAQSGKIQYQGKDINKFYIEGSDMLGGKYGVATNGINHEDVSEVEVMENHQPMQVLAGLSFSDKAAINLKMKSKAKASWSGYGDLGAGYSQQPEEATWEAKLFALAVMPKFQSLTLVESNNTGTDLRSRVVDFFSSGRGTGLSALVGVDMPEVPNLRQSRTLFNRSAMLSTNALWKLSTGEVKAQVDYAFNRIATRGEGITTYYLNDGGEQVVTEDRHGVEHDHQISARMTYEVNARTAFVNNTLTADVGLNDARLDMTGSLDNTQKADLPDYYVSNKFKMIKRFGGNRLVTFHSANEWESLPQTLTVTSLRDGGRVRQHVGEHAFYTRESAEFAFSIKRVSIWMEAGMKGYWRTMHSDLTGVTYAGDEELENVVSTDYVSLLARPRLEYWKGRVNVSLGLPMTLTHYGFDKALANRTEFTFSPSINVNWKPSKRVEVGVNGGAGRSPMSLGMIQPGLVMTDYRTLRRGVDEFYTTTSQNVGADVQYKLPRRGLFFNAYLSQYWSDRPYTMAQILAGDYVTYGYSSTHSKNNGLRVSGDMGKTINVMRGSLKIRGNYSRSESHLLNETSPVNSTSTSWGAGGSLSLSPMRWLDIDYRVDYSRSRLAMNGRKEAWLGSLRNDVDIDVRPHRKWSWRIMMDHYSNDLTSDRSKSVVLVDTKVVYRLSKRLELSGRVSNVLDSRMYNYVTYSELSSYESRRYLRGREFMVTLSLKK